MWQYNYTPSSDELYHYGIPGMRWGNVKAKYYTNNVNRNRKNAIEERKQAKGLMNEAKEYEKSIKTSGTWKAKRLTKMAEAAKNEAKEYEDYAKESDSIAKYQQKKADSQKIKNQELAKKSANKNTKEKVAKLVNKTSKAIGTVAVASLVDDVFYAGKGKKIAKAAGRAAVTGFMKARGRSITWLDPL